ncbi:CHAT domain-containing protein [Argonema antarcticum]|uniref:CHAT domain-containing protein n=1 Tax=Argonema antarcticum TaxID=2942763 RepID=UPI002011E606|nr:CHAT domain-containing tetratricopeptide repeat protein [Argonema antarcticum]
MTVHLRKIGFTVLITLLSAGAIPFAANLRVILSTPPVLAQTPDARKAEADRLIEQGTQQYQSNQFEAAVKSWQQALNIYREIKDREEEGRVLGNMGVAYLYLGDYPKAIAYHQQRLAIAQEIKDRKGEGHALGNLGNAYYFLGDYPKAIAYQQQKLVIVREIKDRQGEGESLGNLGIVYYNLGDYAKAIEYHQQSLAIAREIKDRKGEGRVLGNLGNTYFSLGDYPKAIAYHQQRLAIAQEIKDRQGEGAALGNLGIAYDSLGDYPKAIAYQQQKLAIVREIKDRQGEGESLGNLGLVYYNLGDYAKAIAYHQQSLAIAQEIKDRQGEGAALGNLGIAYDSLGDYPKAIAYQQQKLAIVREIKDLLGEGQSLNNLGRTLFKSGNLAAAETNLNNAIEVFESLRGGLTDAQKVSIFEQQSTSYRTLQEVLIAQNKTDTALEIAERGRARAFVELLAKKLTSNPQETLPTASLKPTITQLKKIAQQQKSTLVQYSIIYDDFQIQGKQQWKQSELYIWVIKPTGEVTFRRSDLKPLWQKQNTTLADLVTTSRESIGVRGRGLFVSARVEVVNPTEKLQQLYQLLIQPITDLLPTDPNGRVTFVPQNELFLVPFVALLDAQGKYLIEKHTILTAPSIQVLDLTHQQRQLVSGKDILIVGNPNMPSIAEKIGETPQKLPSLPGSETEAKTIAQLFNTQALTGNDATKLAILQLLPKARIIHLATHGLIDDFTGLGIPGAVALAPSGNDNGLLTSSEILDLKLHAELVVLSACDTGRGKLTGDGVIGLSRSLISAGVPSVIVSLWSVPDAPTAVLMTEFYQNLQNNPDKAQALRQAMLKTMKNHPEPKNWAAFTLIGEAE